MHGLSFIASPCMVDLDQKMPASLGVSRDGCDDQDSDKRYATHTKRLYNVIHINSPNGFLKVIIHILTTLCQYVMFFTSFLQQTVTCYMYINQQDARNSCD